MFSSFVNLLDESDWEADPAVQEMLHQTSRRSSTSRYVTKVIVDIMQGCVCARMRVSVYACVCACVCLCECACVCTGRVCVFVGSCLATNVFIGKCQLHEEGGSS